MSKSDSITVAGFVKLLQKNFKKLSIEDALFFIRLAYLVRAKTFKIRNGGKNYSGKHYLPVVIHIDDYILPSEIKEEPFFHPHRVRAPIGALPCLGAGNNGNAHRIIKNLMNRGLILQFKQEGISGRLLKINDDYLHCLKSLIDEPSPVLSFVQYIDWLRKNRSGALFMLIKDDAIRYVHLCRIVRLEQAFAADHISNNDSFPFMDVSTRGGFIIPEDAHEHLGYEYNSGSSKQAYKWVHKAIENGLVHYDTDEPFRIRGRSFLLAISAPTEQDIERLFGDARQTELHLEKKFDNLNDSGSVLENMNMADLEDEIPEPKESDQEPELENSDVGEASNQDLAGIVFNIPYDSKDLSEELLELHEQNRKKFLRAKKMVLQGEHLLEEVQTETEVIAFQHSEGKLQHAMQVLEDLKSIDPSILEKLDPAFNKAFQSSKKNK